MHLLTGFIKRVQVRLRNRQQPIADLFIALLGLGAVSIFMYAYFWMNLWEIRPLDGWVGPLRVEEEKDILDKRRTVLYVVASLFAAVGAVLSYRRTRTFEKQLELSERSQADERFATAVQLLGSEKASTRLGAIYALSHLGKSKPDEYETTVVKLLCAFSREHSKIALRQFALYQEQITRLSRLRDEDKGSSPEAERLEAALENRRLDGWHEQQRDDISTAVRLISLVGRENLYLSNIIAQGIDLRASSFRGTRMRAAHLDGAILTLSDLRQIDATGSSFKGAQLNFVVLQGQLRAVDFSEAEFTGTRLLDASFYYCNFNGANLSDSFLNGVEFREKNQYDARTKWPEHFSPESVPGLVLTPAPMPEVGSTAGPQKNSAELL